MVNKSDKISSLVKAVIAVTQEVKNIEKNLKVGDGNHTYQGVADKDVKLAIGQAMAKHGLSILPIGVEPTTKIERWTEQTNYGVKTKQSIFSEVKTTYLLVHESGEFIELQGYGHGVDSQDKSAGKATTYALKYTLLYAFLVPTGNIDDADKGHSDEAPLPPLQPLPTLQQPAPAAAEPVKVDYVPEHIQKAIDTCIDEQQLSNVWENNKPLHKTKVFIEAVKVKKATFKK